MKKLEGFHAEIFQSDFVDSYSPIKDAKNVTIIDPDLPALFEADEKHPPVRLVRRILQKREYIHAEPLERGSYAFGGRFIYTSDSRFRELNDYPIPLHDRDMSKEARF